MAAPRWLSFALGLALAAPVAAYAYGGATPPSHHHQSRWYHGMVAHRAAAPVVASASAPSVAFWPPSYTTSHRLLEIEGLTRNPNACIRFGCIGNN